MALVERECNHGGDGARLASSVLAHAGVHTVLTMATNATVAMANALLSATLESRAAFSRAARSFGARSTGAELQARADDQDRVARYLQSGLSPAKDARTPMRREAIAPDGALEGVDEHTVVLLAAILESRRAYRLAMSLAEQLLLSPLVPAVPPLRLVVDGTDELEAHYW
jgi:hypothetical protein